MRLVLKNLANLSTAALLAWSGLAMAQSQNAPFRMDIQSNPDGSNNNIKRFSKDELAKKPPQASENLEDLLSEEVVGLLNTMGSSDASHKNFRKLMPDDPRENYFLKFAVGKDGFAPRESDPDELRSRVQKETVAALTARHFENSAFWKKLSAGLDLDLDFTKIFSPSEPVKKNKPKDNVRYGLIMKSVANKPNPKLLRAANGSSLQELQYASQADVEWTIGPIFEKENKKVFNAQVDIPAYYDENLHTDDKTYNPEMEELAQPIDITQTETDYWSKGYLPKPSFKTNVKPADKKNGLRGFAENHQLPLKITMSQEQGLYVLDFWTATKSSPRVLEHQFKVPVYGTFAMGRRYNEKMEVIVTSAHNILLVEGAPQVNLYNYEQSKQYVAEGVVNTADGLSLTVKARSDARNADRAKRNNNRGYEVGVKKSF